MRNKFTLLLFGLLVPLFASAQVVDDTIRTLIISELRFSGGDYHYVELTNVGSEAVNLSEFKLLTDLVLTMMVTGRLCPMRCLNPAKLTL